MTAVLAAATVAVVLALVGVVAGFLWFIGTMVLQIAEILSARVAPGAQAVAGHVGSLPTAIQRLDHAIAELGGAQ